MPVSLVVVTNRDGLPLYFSQLTDLYFEVDPTLFSGFLAAMASFSRAVRKDFQLVDLGLGNLRLFFDHGEIVITIIGILTHDISSKKLSRQMIENYHKIVALLGQSFHKSFAAKIEGWDGDPNAFTAFKQTTDLVLGVEGYSREKHFEELLEGFDNGQISQNDLVEQIWDILEGELKNSEGI
ncbi:MAG: roadblock/LC7 domain-containing protein [Candidatus Hodarchaeota archaeon]